MVVTIHHYELDEFTDALVVEFSTKDDGDDFFRKDEIEVSQLSMYLPPHFTSARSWVEDLDDDTLIDALNEYYTTNALPDPQLL